MLFPRLLRHHQVAICLADHLPWLIEIQQHSANVVIRATCGRKHPVDNIEPAMLSFDRRSRSNFLNVPETISRSQDRFKRPPVYEVWRRADPNITIATITAAWAVQLVIFAIDLFRKQRGPAILRLRDRFNTLVALKVLRASEHANRRIETLHHHRSDDVIPIVNFSDTVVDEVVVAIPRLTKRLRVDKVLLRQFEIDTVLGTSHTGLADIATKALRCRMLHDRNK